MSCLLRTGVSHVDAGSPEKTRGRSGSVLLKKHIARVHSWTGARKKADAIPAPCPPPLGTARSNYRRESRPVVLGPPGQLGSWLRRPTPVHPSPPGLLGYRRGNRDACTYQYTQEACGFAAGGLAGPGGKMKHGPARPMNLGLRAPTFTRRFAARWEGPGLALTCASKVEPRAGRP